MVRFVLNFSKQFLCRNRCINDSQYGRQLIKFVFLNAEIFSIVVCKNNYGNHNHNDGNDDDDDDISDDSYKDSHNNVNLYDDSNNYNNESV